MTPPVGLRMLLAVLGTLGLFTRRLSGCDAQQTQSPSDLCSPFLAGQVIAGAKCEGRQQKLNEAGV